jgi:superfamily II DNA or RNA helicase
MPLRPYQEKLFLDVRAAFKGRRSVLMQLATGGGKTWIFSEMSKSAQKYGQTVWILVPRNELLSQASEHLAAAGVPHGRIDARHQESTAFSVQVVSKDTLIRRYDKIKKKPTFIIVDEAHLALDRYIEISKRFPDAKILGVTATPERLDGRGLSDLYETMVMGPSIRELVELGFLSDVEYYAPPIQGIEKLHRIGTDYKADELEALLETRKIYGESIRHYRKHAGGKPCLVYCRSVKAAEETADRFTAGGYRFLSIDGKMTPKERKKRLDALRTGKIHGLTSCELVTYGLDVPAVKAIIMLRPTLSRSLYSQMVGRGLRPTDEGSKCVIIDHVANYQEHGHPLADYNWQFYGREKRKPRKEKDELIARLCPELDFMYCHKASCIGCEHNPNGRKSRREEMIDLDLIKVKPIALKDRPREEKKEIVDRINLAIIEYEKTGLAPGPVGELLAVAKELRYSDMWVYRKLTRGKYLVNRSLLHEIGRQRGHKKGWAWFQAKRIREEKS